MQAKYREITFTDEDVVELDDCSYRVDPEEVNKFFKSTIEPIKSSKRPEAVIV